MTDMGRRSGDMDKTDYDTGDDGTVDDSEKLEGSTKSEVQDHTPKAHTHEESEITDLSHDATAIAGVEVDDTDIGNGKVLEYNSSSQKLEYETPTTGGGAFVDRGDPDFEDFSLGDLTTSGTWTEMDLSGVVPESATAVLLAVSLADDAASSYIQFRKLGISNDKNVWSLQTQVSGVNFYASSLVALDAARKIEYRTTNTTWTSINIRIRGWFI